MKKLFTLEKLHILRELAAASSQLLLDENRDFFTVLGEEEYLLSFHWLDEKKVVVYASATDFILCTDSETVQDYGTAVSEDNDGLLQFHQFLLELTASDIYRLETLENMIMALESRLLLENVPTTAGLQDILKVRKDMLKAKRYYAHMNFISDEMEGIDPGFSFLSNKFKQLMDFVCQLQNHIESVREAYQSQIDIEQNNIMKLFTVITTIFTPLTLITGWYGMNFDIPEYGWDYSYGFICFLAFTIVLALVLIFRRKGWF